MPIAPTNSEIKGVFYLLELTGQDISVVMRILLLIKTFQSDQSNAIYYAQRNCFSKKALGKCLFHFTK